MSIYTDYDTDEDPKKITPGSINLFREHVEDWMRKRMYVWDASRRFLEGIQYGRRLNDGTWRVETSKPGMVRLTINLILPIYNRLYSMLAVATPHVSARPSSATREDLVKAKCDAALVQYVWDQADIAKAFREANRWLITCGNVGLHTYFCRDMKKVKVKVVSPYNLMVQPGCEQIDDSDYLMVRDFITRAEMRRRFPRAPLDRLEPVEYDRQNRPYVIDYAESQTYKVKRYQIFEYWDRNGNHMITSGDFVLWKAKKGEWDGTGAWPVEHIRFHGVPGRFHGIGAIEPLISVQREYNAQRSAIIGNIKLLGNVQWLNPVNSGVDRITNEPGAQIRYNPAAPPPQQASPAPLPGYIMDNVMRCQSEIMDLAGIHGASLGKRVSGVQSGAAIDALVNQDTSQLQGVQDNIERAAIAVSRRILTLAKKYFTEGMMVRMFNQDGGMFYKQIKASDLTEDPDIFLEASTLFSNMLEDRERRAVQMFQLQLLSPDEARRAINFFGMDSQIAQTVRNYNMALDVLEHVIAGAEVTIHRTDPLQELTEVFGEFVVSDEFFQMAEEVQANIQNVYRAILAQGDQNLMMQLEEPIYPQQQQPQPQGMGPGIAGAPMLPGEQIPQEQAGGTSQGAINREQGKQQAAIFEAPGMTGGFG